MGTNASLIYYRGKTSSKSLDNKDVKELLGISVSTLNKRAIICGVEYKEYFKIVSDDSCFSLKTTYPGLIIGSGYNHPPFEESDFQLGFYFDHTTGMPVIPGSTVKGILKSVFPKKNESNEVKLEKLKYVNSLIEQISAQKTLINAQKTLFSEENWQNLFDKGDIFHDAYVSNAPSDNKGKIFAEDYITPHTKGPFKNPVPIRFLKIAPGVTFTFQFKLVESKFEDKIVSPGDKLELFKKIILDFGIGAKRNIGYGNFDDVSISK